MPPQALAERARPERPEPTPARPPPTVAKPAAHPLVALQRSAGNQAVQLLVAPSARAVIQRKPDPGPGPDAPPAPPPRRGRAAAARTPELPRSMLIEVALQRLEEPEIKDYPGVELLRRQLQTDLATPPGPDEELQRRHAERLHRTLTVAQAVLKPLAELAKPANYLPDVQKPILRRVNEIKGRYAAAILVSYSDVDPKERFLADAEQGMNDLPAFIVEQYLGPNGIQRLIEQLGELGQQIQQLRAAGDVAPAQTSMRFTLGDPKRLAAREDELRRDLQAARAARGDAAKATETIGALTAKAQAAVGITTAVALYEQFNYWTNELRDSFIDIFIELGKDVWEAAGERDKEVWEIPLGYALKLETIVYQLQKLDAVTDPERAREITDEGMRALGTIVNAPAFKPDVETIQSRLETVGTINVLGTIVLIAAAAALTAGVAGAAVGGVLEFAGAGTLVVGAGEVAAGALAFTIVSREGQKLAFGKAEGSFGWDLFTNALMFGFLKTVDLAYTAAFKLGPQAGTAAKLAYGLGRAGTAMIALQAFAAAEHEIKTGKAMTLDEHGRAALQNLVVLVALSAGRFITQPIETRITGAINARLKPLFESRLSDLATERQRLGVQLDALKRHEGEHDPTAVGAALEGIQALWQKELRLLESATRRGVLKQAELEPVLARYRAELAGLELQLARLNVPAQLGVTAPSFRPVAAGVVLYEPGAEQTLQDFHMANKGTLTASKRGTGVLEGRIGGELTFYVPEGQAFARLPEAARLAAVRDAALREAAADPQAQLGLENLAKMFGALKADEVLVAAPPEHLGALLRALADADVVAFKRPEFYRALAQDRVAMDFSEVYGAKTLRNLALQYEGNKAEWSEAFSKDVLPRATAAIERAPSLDARAELLEALRSERNTAKLDELIGKAPPAKPERAVRTTTRAMRVDRRPTRWTRFRDTESASAIRHKESATPEQLDRRADVLMILDNAKAGAFDHLEHDAKVAFIDRYDRVCIEEAGIGRGRTNALRGSLSEVLLRPVRGAPKRAFLKGEEKPIGTIGATIPDYGIAHPGFTEHVNQKSDWLKVGRPNRRGVWSGGVDAANTYYRRADLIEADNIPATDRYSLDFTIDPGEATRRAMLRILFKPGSKIFRVKFGTDWYDRSSVR